MNAVNDLILDQPKINHIVRRIAYQIYETNVNESQVVIAGIKENGVVFAKKLKLEVEKISPLKVILCEIHINKKIRWILFPLPPTRLILKTNPL